MRAANYRPSKILLRQPFRYQKTSATEHPIYKLTYTIQMPYTVGVWLVVYFLIWRNF
jgi:hypothetical protein